MKKNNFFYFKEKNNWDIGWPCSPRVFIGIILFSLSILYLSGVLN